MIPGRCLGDDILEWPGEYCWLSRPRVSRSIGTHVHGQTGFMRQREIQQDIWVVDFYSIAHG